MNPSESPLERLNYYNGQRLESSDLRLEQEYHMRVRRWLNKSLYTWGIAAGLEVTVKQNPDQSLDRHKVIVQPGLALDHEGHEIILLEPREIQVVGIPPTDSGVVLGNYLTIEYGDYPVAPVEDGCPRSLNGKSNNSLAWGGPTRIREEPKISWQNSWPSDSSGKIVLAQAELDKTCAVKEIQSWVRRHVGAAQPPRALAYALGGEKDIDKDNSKRINFHIRGGRPNAVTLYLRGSKFSSLYYTELGRHTHNLNLTIKALEIPQHSHKFGDIETTGESSSIVHTFSGKMDGGDSRSIADAGTADEVDILRAISGKINHADSHTHKIPDDQTTQLNEKETSISINNLITQKSLSYVGTYPGIAINESPHEYIKNLEIWLNGNNYTVKILDQLGWTEKDHNSGGSLGDDSAGHILNEDGTGPIRLDLLAALNEGLNTIELKINQDTGRGGQIHYNLYVE